MKSLISLVLFILVSNSSNGAVLITANEVGNDVVFSYSGSVNTSSLSLIGSLNNNIEQITASHGQILNLTGGNTKNYAGLIRPAISVVD